MLHTDNETKKHTNGGNDMVFSVGNDRNDIPWNLLYKAHQISKVISFSSRLEVVFAQSIEARC